MSFRENRIQKAVMGEEKIFKSTTAFLCLKGDFENGYSKNGYIGCYKGLMLMIMMQYLIRW